MGCCGTVLVPSSNGSTTRLEIPTLRPLPPVPSHHGSDPVSYVPIRAGLPRPRSDLETSNPPLEGTSTWGPRLEILNTVLTGRMSTLHLESGAIPLPFPPYQQSTPV